MRLQKYLDEEYECRVTQFGNSYEVFTNPSHKEIREVGLVDNTLKFIADGKTKKVYIWSVLGPLHEPAWKQITGRNMSSDTLSGRTLPGYAEFRGGKLQMESGDGNDFFEDILSGSNMVSIRNKWKWVNRYIDTSTYLGKNLDE